jgi:AbrB family looped-hinge helix DNA binding protein
MRVKVARRYQITLPEEVRKELRLNVGDSVEVRSEGRRAVVEKIERNWALVMKETRGAWSDHPIFKGMKDSIEIVNWLRQRKKR